MEGARQASLRPPIGPGRGVAAVRAGLARINLYGLVTLLALVGLWQLLVDTGVVTAQYIVAPTEIVSAAGDLLSTGELQEATVHTLSAVLIGWAIAMVAGVLLGCLFGLFRAARTYGMSTVDLLRSLPTIALVPPAVLVFGFSLRMEVAVIVYATLWPILINTAGGIAQVPRELHDAARTLRLSRSRTAASVIVPAALPAIIVGARLGMAVAVILAVVAEMVGTPEGLGYGMVFAQQAIQPADMFACIITIGLLGVVLNAAVVAVSRLLPAVAAAQAERERR
ncbi:MAG: ABC transporter permease subunit [Solirubrobacterales bacterium]|nr:ABC transporter permease subunit [Solirubrobacterales bacterium]